MTFLKIRFIEVQFSCSKIKIFRSRAWKIMTNVLQFTNYEHIKDMEYLWHHKKFPCDTLYNQFLQHPHPCQPWFDIFTYDFASSRINEIIPYITFLYLHPFIFFWNSHITVFMNSFFFFKLRSLLYGCTTFCLSIHQLTNIWNVSRFQLVINNLHIFVCAYAFIYLR